MYARRVLPSETVAYHLTWSLGDNAFSSFVWFIAAPHSDGIFPHQSCQSKLSVSLFASLSCRHAMTVERGRAAPVFLWSPAVTLQLVTTFPQLLPINQCLMPPEVFYTQGHHVGIGPGHCARVYSMSDTSSLLRTRVGEATNPSPSVDPGVFGCHH